MHQNNWKLNSNCRDEKLWCLGDWWGRGVKLRSSQVAPGYVRHTNESDIDRHIEEEKKLNKKLRGK